MQLTKNFSLEELTATNTGLINLPNADQIDNLKKLAENVLQPLRDIYGMSIHVNSGFRSDKVNKKVGGSATSAHCDGQAADLSCSDNAKIFNIIRKTLKFDQLIWESGDDTQPKWVHVSFRKRNNRNQVLKMTNGKYQII